MESRELPRGTISNTVFSSRLVACVLIQAQAQRQYSGRGILSEGGAMLSTLHPERVHGDRPRGVQKVIGTDVLRVMHSGPASPRELDAPSSRGFDEHV